MNDPTLSRSFLEFGDAVFLPYTFAFDCRDQRILAVANLEITPIKFSPSVLPYHATGYQAFGGAVLSPTNEVMTIYARGLCGSTYFAYYSYSEWELIVGDNHPVLGEHLLPVTF